MSVAAPPSSASSPSDPFDPLRLSSLSSLPFKACPVCLNVIAFKADEDPDVKLQEHIDDCVQHNAAHTPHSSRTPSALRATSTASTSASSTSTSQSSTSHSSASLSSPPNPSHTSPSTPFDATPSRPSAPKYPPPSHASPMSEDDPAAAYSDHPDGDDDRDNDDARPPSPPFEEDEDAGALQWSKLQPLDRSDAAGGALDGGRGGARVPFNEVAAAASALISGGLGAMKTETRNGDREDGHPSPATTSPSTAPARPQGRLPPFPSPNITSVFSPGGATSNKRSHNALTAASSAASSSPAAASSSAPASSAAGKTAHVASSSRKRRKKEDEETSLNLAYERQISVLNEAIRQLLAYVSPLHSHSDTFVDELISAYRGEYMKEQLRDGRTAENKKYARAMAAFFLTYYHNPNINVQLAIQHFTPNAHPGQPTLPHTQNGGAHPSSSPKSDADGGDAFQTIALVAAATTSAAASTVTSPTAAPSGGPGSGGASPTGAGTPSSLVSPKDLVLHRIPLDPWEGLSHPLYPNLTLLLYTIIDALLMDTLQIALFSLYLEKLEPFFVLETAPAAQTRLLLLTAYAMKLAYLENHSIFLPYLTGLYPSFSKLFADYIHAKPGVKLGVANVALTNRFRLFGGLREKE